MLSNRHILVSNIDQAMQLRFARTVHRRGRYWWLNLIHCGVCSGCGAYDLMHTVLYLVSPHKVKGHFWGVMNFLDRFECGRNHVQVHIPGRNADRHDTALSC